jgi:apolipoprotein N-acyltransferase
MTGSDRICAIERLTAYNSLYLFGQGAACHLSTSSIWCRSANMCPCAAAERIGISQLTVGSAFGGRSSPCAEGAPAPPVTPLICYEVIFPHAVVDPAEPAPGWLVTSPTIPGSGPGRVRSSIC